MTIAKSTAAAASESASVVVTSSTIPSPSKTTIPPPSMGSRSRHADGASCNYYCYSCCSTVTRGARSHRGFPPKRLRVRRHYGVSGIVFRFLVFLFSRRDKRQVERADSVELYQGCCSWDLIFRTSIHCVRIRRGGGEGAPSALRGGNIVL